jgi:hypothetical protein
MNILLSLLISTDLLFTDPNSIMHGTICSQLGPSAAAGTQPTDRRLTEAEAAATQKISRAQTLACFFLLRPTQTQAPEASKGGGSTMHCMHMLFLSIVHIQIHTHLKWGGYG